jgi:RHS repeat-associated protein
MTNIAGFTPTYDSNGNVTTDTLHTYIWNVDGRPVTVDSVNLTYDALGRMVEQNRSGTYAEIVYAPTGDKIEAMNGQSVTKTIVPLPGGAVASNSSAGPLYHHPDHLGSTRFVSTSSRTMYYDGAYAPFGEPYAQSGTSDLSFTGMNQDTVAGLYDFPAREYSIQGRWPSPDPAGVSATCTKNPQTQNRYAYVTNNPLSYVDPLGFQGFGPKGGGDCDPFFEDCSPPPCDPFFDPFCFGGCDPTVDPFCGIGPVGGGGGGGGGGRGGNPEKPPRPFPWPMMPLGFFQGFEGQNGNTQTLKLTRATCTETKDRGGPGYELGCWWKSSTQTMVATAPCSFHATEYALGGCVDQHTAYETLPDGSFDTITCAPEVEIDLNCDEFSAKRPFFLRVGHRLM